MTEHESDQQRHRPIRSYVLRLGRLTPAQEAALEQLLPRYGIDAGGDALDWAEVFGRACPVIVEVGFGDGAALATMALGEPDSGFIGIEVHLPGVGRLLRRLQDESIDNVRVVTEDAVAFLRERVPEASLAGVRIWFPDPWPKKRHHKRRLVQADFVRLLASRMAPGAILHLATDWVPYAEHMLEVLQAESAFENLSAEGGYCPRPSWRPLTRFEQRGDRLGHETRDLLFRRTGQPASEANTSG